MAQTASCHESLNEAQLDHLISGYMRQNYLKPIPNEITQFIFNLFDDIFRWIIKGDELHKFLNAKPGEHIYSKRYNCNGIDFTLCLCPNGASNKDKGYVRFVIYIADNDDLWYYKDGDGGKDRGPMRSVQMNQWFEEGWIPKHLSIRNQNTSFMPLKDWFIKGNKAFTTKIPKYWPVPYQQPAIEIIEQPFNDTKDTDDDEEDIGYKGIDSITLYHYISSPQCIPYIGKGMSVLGMCNGKMWAPHCMKLADCQQYKSLQFNCYVQILDVEYKDKSKIYKFAEHITMKRKVKLEWNVDDKLLNMFKDCNDSNEYKSFYSPYFQDYNWSLMCYPNGDHKDIPNTKGKFYLCLRTQRLPSKIGKVELEIKVECNQANEDYNGDEKYIITRPDGWSSGAQIYLFKTQKLLDISCLWFIMNIKLLNAFDTNGNVINVSKFSQYGIL